MLKKLDWYIIKKFLGTFFFMMAVLMSMAVVFDVSERIDDFISKGAPLSAIITQYYFNFVAYYGNLFSPLIIFISVIWFTSKMAQNSEIVPILSSGVSFMRLMRPYFIAATFLTLVSLALNHFVVPHANKIRLEFEEMYYRNEYHSANVYTQIKPGEFVYFYAYNAGKNMIVKFFYEKWENEEMTFSLRAEKAYGDSTTNDWRFENYFIREIGPMKDGIHSGKVLDTTMNFKILDFQRRSNKASAMTYNELDEFIAVERMRGSKQIPSYEIEKHQRTSYPFATYVLTLIGIAVSSRKSRQGIGKHIATGLFLVFIYIFMIRVADVSVTNMGVPAAISVWIPNLIFGLIGVLLYRRAPK